MSQSAADVYYVPHKSRWPIVATIGMFLFMVGLANWLNGHGISGKIIFAVGALTIIGMMFGWFGTVIRESMNGVFNPQADTSFRLGMTWFIFSEVFFFAAFFGGLLYIRLFVVPWLGGEGDKGILTNAFIWRGYAGAWPTDGPLNVGGDFTVGSPWGIPLLNTLLLLSSSITLTVAHHALRADNRKRLIAFLALTIVLGATFLGFQVYEYWESYVHLNMTLHSGIYGSTFYILTGFHGLHVTLGTIMLIVIWLRCLRGHFTPTSHFGFEAVSWYWHFVDVIWLCLFLFVYIL